MMTVLCFMINYSMLVAMVTYHDWWLTGMINHAHAISTIYWVNVIVADSRNQSWSGYSLLGSPSGHIIISETPVVVNQHTMYNSTHTLNDHWDQVVWTVGWSSISSDAQKPIKVKVMFNKAIPRSVVKWSLTWICKEYDVHVAKTAWCSWVKDQSEWSCQSCWMLGECKQKLDKIVILFKNVLF